MSRGRKPSVAKPNWRLTASEEDLREYDAFGPWIYEIKDESDAPKRFRPACRDHYGARFLLKVPCNVERRNVRPGMDLYSAVLAVHDDGVCFMRLVGESVVPENYAWRDVVVVESYKDLLYSRWRLLLRHGGAFTLEYSTVSSGLMTKVTNFVRAQWARRQDAPRAPERDQSAPVIDIIFENELNARRRSGPQPVTLLHAEPMNQYCRDSADRRRLSTGVMFLESPDELIIVNHGEPTRRFLEARYALGSVFVPYARVNDFALERSPVGRARRFHQLILRLDRQVIRQSCLVAPERVLARLAASVAPPADAREAG